MGREIADAIERAASAAPDDSRRQRRWRSIERIHPFLAIYETCAENESLRANIHCVVTSRCNYRCPFCQASLSSAADDDAEADPTLEELKQGIERAARIVPGARWTLSGGEPTLRRDLPEIVDAILSRDPEAVVVLQTNGAFVGRHPERYEFPPSPRLRFLVALHALDQAHYDAVTATRGQLRSAVAGMNALLAAGHVVEINCVICSLNADHLHTYVERLPGACEGHAPPVVHLSVLGFTDVRDVSPYAVPYDRVVAIARDAVETGERVGVEVSVSLTARHSSVPVCLLDDGAALSNEYPHMYQHDIQHLADAEWWTKPAGCATCRMEPYCRGLPKPYVAAIGEDGVRPIPPASSERPEDGLGGGATES